jgi:O-antigen ligase
VATAALGRGGRSDRLPAVLVGTAIAAFPLLRPHGPGHITPADVLMGIGIVSVILWAGSTRAVFHLPFVVPITLYVLAGLVAGVFSISPQAGFLAVGQDLFLFVWAAMIANLIRVPKNLSIILGAWAWSATAWATILMGAVVTHQWWLAGANNASGGRAQLQFDNPNMAGDYFLISLFVVLLGRSPKHPVVRTYACVSLLAAILLTGSNAALGSLVLGIAVAVVYAIWRRSDLLVAITATAMVAVVLAGLILYVVASGTLQRIENSSNALVARSLARGPKSAAGRSTLFSEEFDLYLTGSLLGRGPATTKLNLGPAGSIVKEAHDDYLATLVERGPIGVIALVVFMAGIGIRASAISLRPLSPAFAHVVRMPSIAIGCGVALAVTATTHEILHYRHVFALLGIIAGLYLFARETPAQESSRANLLPEAA